MNESVDAYRARLKADRDRRYGALLAAAKESSPSVTAVLELHIPEAISDFYPSHPECMGCFGTVQGSGPCWPDDCETTQVIARHLKVDLS